jgi:hypothetical protein
MLPNCTGREGKKIERERAMTKAAATKMMKIDNGENKFKDFCAECGVLECDVLSL